jgi:hypothetical protein
MDLQETPDVINVEPVVEVDPRGGFLVADVAEAQVRRYTAAGVLAWHAGRKGAGPGEFRAPTAVRRLPSGAVLVADRNERLTLLDSVGAVVLRTLRTPLHQIADLVVVNDSLVLISGLLNSSAQSPRLHLLNLRTDSLVRSFFAPFGNSPNPTIATTAGWSKAAIRADTVAAVFATSDTVYLFTLAGEPLRKLPLPTPHLRRVVAQKSERTSDPRLRAEGLSQFDYVSDIAWLTTGEMIVSYQSILPDKALTRQWHLLRIAASGKGIAELRDVPRLLTTGPNTDSLYFIARNAEAPNRWAVAQLQE